MSRRVTDSTIILYEKLIDQTNFLRVLRAVVFSMSAVSATPYRSMTPLRAPRRAGAEGRCGVWAHPLITVSLCALIISARKHIPLMGQLALLVRAVETATDLRSTSDLAVWRGYTRCSWCRVGFGYGVRAFVTSGT